MIINIRREKEPDYEKIYYIIKEAFKTAEHADGNEQDLVTALRKSDAFIPELSLVAEIDNEIVGHILFTKLKIGDKTELALAPLSVLPNFQRKGVGTALINEGHRIGKLLGYRYSVVLGSEKYYPKVGYKRADIFGIKAPFDVPMENFMAFDLQGNSKPASGEVKYAREFDI